MVLTLPRRLEEPHLVKPPKSFLKNWWASGRTRPVSRELVEAQSRGMAEHNILIFSFFFAVTAFSCT